MGRMGRWVYRSLLVAMTVLVAALAVIAPRMAYAAEPGDVAQIGDQTYGSFADAVAAVPTSGEETTITLIDDAAIDAGHVRIVSGQNVRLDLAGHRLEISNTKKIMLGGTLTITDSSENQSGVIAGVSCATAMIDMTGSKTARLVVESGAITSDRITAVSVTAAGASLVMTGGTIEAPRPVQMQYASSATIMGGLLKATSDDYGAIEMAGGSPSLAVGSAGKYDQPIIEGSIVAVSSAQSFELVGGTVQGVTGELPDGATLTSRFGSDVASVLPANQQCVERDGAWYVTALGSEAGAGAKIVKSDRSVEYYQLASTALGALSDGDALTLYEDVTGQISVDGITATIDLNGHTVTSDADAAVSLAGSNANLTITNGNIVSTSPSENAAIVMVAAPNGMDNASLTLKGVNLTMQKSGGAGIQVYGRNTKNAVTLEGCTLTVPDDVMGIYFPAADSTLTVHDTQITAGTGIGIKGGTLVVSGNSAIHAKGEKDSADIPASGGIAETGAAIYVDGGYKDRPIKVDIQGGSFTSDKGSALEELVDPVRPDETPVTIAVSGGSFSDASIKGCLTGNAAVVVHEDGTCDVYPTEADALANGGSYKVVDDEGHTWLFQNEKAAQDFTGSQGGASKPVEQVTHTVTFDDCLENTENASAEVPNGQTVVQPQDPVCAGYRFLGWYELENGAYAAEAYDFTTPVTADLTLYAKWERISGQPSDGNSTADQPSGGTLEQTGDLSVLAMGAFAAAGMTALGAGAVVSRKRK